MSLQSPSDRWNGMEWNDSGGRTHTKHQLVIDNWHRLRLNRLYLLLGLFDRCLRCRLLLLLLGLLLGLGLLGLLRSELLVDERLIVVRIGLGLRLTQFGLRRHLLVALEILGFKAGLLEQKLLKTLRLLQAAKSTYVVRHVSRGNHNQYKLRIMLLARLESRHKARTCRKIGATRRRKYLRRFLAQECLTHQLLGWRARMRNAESTGKYRLATQ